MAYYNVCPNCGSNLDPNEKCDCESTQEREKEQSRHKQAYIYQREPRAVVII